MFQGKSNRQIQELLSSFVEDIELRLSARQQSIAKYKNGPREAHTLCYIAIGEGQLHELEFVRDYLKQMAPSQQVN